MTAGPATEIMLYDDVTNAVRREAELGNGRPEYGYDRQTPCRCQMHHTRIVRDDGVAGVENTGRILNAPDTVGTLHRNATRCGDSVTQFPVVRSSHQDGYESLLLYQTTAQFGEAYGRPAFRGVMGARSDGDTTTNGCRAGIGRIIAERPFFGQPYFRSAAVECQRQMGDGPAIPRHDGRDGPGAPLEIDEGEFFETMLRCPHDVAPDALTQGGGAEVVLQIDDEVVVAARHGFAHGELHVVQFRIGTRAGFDLPHLPDAGIVGMDTGEAACDGDVDDGIGIGMLELPDQWRGEDHVTHRRQPDHENGLHTPFFWDICRVDCSIPRSTLTMKFSVEQDDELVIFTIKEPSLDSTNAPDVKSELLILCQPNVKALVIDMSMVHFCDSQGLSSLLLAHRQMSEAEGFVILVGMQDQVRNLFRISQIEYLFEFQPTLADAITWLQAD